MFLLIFILWIMFNGERSHAVMNPRKVVVRAGGGTLPASIYKVWKPVYQAYRSTYTEVDLTYEPIGSGAGIKGFEEHLYDYAASDELLSDKVYNNHSDYQLFPSFAVPVSIAYNIPELSPDSTTAGSKLLGMGNLNLTQSNLVKIFSGVIKFWNDSSLSEANPLLAEINQPILVAVRMDSSGTTSIFTRALEAFSSRWPNPFASFSAGCNSTGVPQKWNSSLNAHCAQGSRGLSSYLLNTPYSIGFIGTSEARDSGLPDARLLNRDGLWLRPSVETTQAAMDNVSSDLGPRLTGSITNAPGPRSYPIAGYTYILIRKTTMENCTVAMEIYRMFAYLLENPLAQSIVSDLINAPLSPAVLRQVKQHALAEMKCAGVSVSSLAAVAVSIEDGTYDAWKLPVIVVGALAAAALVMFSVFYLYIEYVNNRNALRSTFVVGLHVIEAGAAKSAGSLPTMSMVSTNPSKATTRETMDWTSSSGVGVVKVTGGEQYLVRQLCRHLSPETAQWATKVLLVRLKDKMAHPNMLRLVGVSWLDSRWKLVSGLPRKGRLQDVLHAGKYHLDAVFRYSILSDVAEGMIYLHRNGLVHGQLTSNSCYIDGKWNVVVGDWEQAALHQAQNVPFIAFENLYDEANADPDKDISSYSEYLRCLFWSAPEAISRDSNDIYIVSKPEKPADVYSYGVIAYEVFTDMLPYENTVEHNAVSHPHHIITAVKLDNLRPSIPVEAELNSVHILKLFSVTWRSDPASRPTFVDVQKLLKLANPRSRSIIDSMMQAVENYALSLEEKVAERTRDLERLTKNMESVLHSILPPTIADRLAKGLTVEPEIYESSTLFFSDIVGFTTIAAASSPIDIVNLLNDLYSAFDGVIKRFDVYKVETIGDSYMCISGLPNRNGDEHASQIASMSLDMLFTVTAIPIRHMVDRKLQVRIGVHTGVVVAGVVGITMPRYCLFGDTVNTASRMESSSLPMRIQISEATRSLLERHKVYTMVPRGELNIKGKGAMKTYWLIGKQGYTNPLPAFDPTMDAQLSLLLDEAQVK